MRFWYLTFLVCHINPFIRIVRSVREDKPLRLAIGSFMEEYNNKVCECVWKVSCMFVSHVLCYGKFRGGGFSDFKFCTRGTSGVVEECRPIINHNAYSRVPCSTPPISRWRLFS